MGAPSERSNAGSKSIDNCVFRSIQIVFLADHAQSCLQLNERNASTSVHHAAIALVPRLRGARRDYGQRYESVAPVAIGTQALGSYRSGDCGQIPQDHGLPQGLRSQINARNCVGL